MTNPLQFLNEIYFAMDNEWSKCSSHCILQWFFQSIWHSVPRTAHLQTMWHRRRWMFPRHPMRLTKSPKTIYTNWRSHIEKISIDQLSTTRLPTGDFTFLHLYKRSSRWSNSLQPFIFADDLKILAIGKSNEEVETDIKGNGKWVKSIKMKLAVNKCNLLQFRGTRACLSLKGQPLVEPGKVKHLGVYIADKLNWSTHIGHRIEKANKVFCCLRRNFALNVQFSIKLGLYKWVILPVLLYGLNCAYQSRTDQRKLNNFQRRVLKWVSRPHRGDCKADLRLLNVLSLTLFIQLNDLLLLSKLYMDIEEHKNNLPNQPWNNRGQVTLKLNKTQTEQRRTEFVYRTARVKDRIQEKVDFNREIGLKNRIINLMWWHVENRFSENNVFTWQLCCDCVSCRNNWTNFWTDSGGTGPSRPTGNRKQQQQQAEEANFFRKIPTPVTHPLKAIYEDTINKKHSIIRQGKETTQRLNINDLVQLMPKKWWNWPVMRNKTMEKARKILLSTVLLGKTNRSYSQ